MIELKLFTVSYRTTERVQRFYDDVLAETPTEAITKVMEVVHNRLSQRDFIDWESVDVFEAISPTEGFKNYD